MCCSLRPACAWRERRSSKRVIRSSRLPRRRRGCSQSRPAGGPFIRRRSLPRARKLARDVSVGPYVVIEEETQIDRATMIEAFCFLGRGLRVGEGCQLHPRVTLYAGSRLGDRGRDALRGRDWRRRFRLRFRRGRHWKFPQIGGVEIGDDVEIGCNTTIDRGSLETTRIGNGVKIDNLVQIAHNVEIGDHTVIVAQTGISGSSTIGKNVAVGGTGGDRGPQRRSKTKPWWAGRQGSLRARSFAAARSFGARRRDPSAIQRAVRVAAAAAGTGWADSSSNAKAASD